MRTGLTRTIILAFLGLLMSSEALAEMRSVRVKKANFRDAPSSGAKVLFTAERHYPVDVIERSRGWAKIRDFEGEEAWVAERLLGNASSVVVKVERANVRQAPSAKAPVASVAVRSEAYPVKERKGEWLLIELEPGAQGWIHASLVWGDEDAPPAAAGDRQN